MRLLRTWLGRVPGARRLGRFLRGLVHPHYRAVRQVERRRPGQLLQPEATTGPGRYPQIIAYVAGQMAAIDQPQVLSWGCSTGAELLALRRAMPHARIVGVDINPRSLAIARQAVGADPNITLVEAGDPADLAGQQFDAVFCMAVLRHALLEERRPESCAHILPFAKAERFATALAGLVRPGGLLALWNVHFRLSDMAIAPQFSVAFALERGRTANQPLYGPTDRRLDGAVTTGAVHRAISAASHEAPA